MKSLIFIAILIISPAGISVRAQTTPWDIIYCLNGGENKSVGILKLPNPNPVEKPGWNLIFSDEFMTGNLDPVKWNRSTPWDDGNGMCNRGFAPNPANISVENGYAKITNTIDSQLPGCPYSYGEIKTMSVADPAFGSYYFYAPGYLETRVKLFNKTGQGAACWLWGIGTPDHPGTSGPWNEIDVFELNGVNGNIFNGAYHWTENNEHVSQHQSIYLTDSFQLYDLSENWTTFGLEWDSSTIRWYVNNLLVKELDLTSIPPFCVEAKTYKPPLSPFCLRLNAGNNSVGNQSGTPNPGDFPQSMLVDYVRVYKKAGYKASPIVIPGGISQVCASAQSPATSDKIISSPYYPETNYQWSSPAFEMQELSLSNPQPPGQKLIWLKPGIIGGTSYPIYSETHFSGNYFEKDSIFLYIPETLPTLPAGSFSAIQVDSLCRFDIRSPQLGYIAGCEFSLDSGMTWHAGTLTSDGGGAIGTFGQFKPGQQVNFNFRVMNACGSSPTGSYILLMPEAPARCHWPTGLEDSFQGNSGISVTPNPFETRLHIRISMAFHPVIREMEVIVYDVFARKVACEQISGAIQSLDLSRLSRGTYFLQVLKQNRIIFSTPIIKS